MSSPASVNNCSVKVVYNCAVTKIERNDTDITIRISHISKEQFQGNSWNESEYENFFSSLGSEIEILEAQIKSSEELRANSGVNGAVEQEKQFLSHVTDVYNSRFGWNLLSQML